jgi:hypothetical protein
MLKGKKGIFILITLNVLIWSFFIYRFVSFYNEEDEVIVKTNKSVNATLNNLDTIRYKLNLSYKDPFLKELKSFNKPIKAPKEREVKREITKSKTDVKPKETMPEIRYLGLVKNNTSGSLTAIVSINGSTKLVKQDECLDGIIFRNFSTNEVQIIWHKEKLIVNK